MLLFGEKKERKFCGNNNGCYVCWMEYSIIGFVFWGNENVKWF